MAKYNSIQKILILLSILVFVGYLFYAFSLLLENTSSSVLGETTSIAPMENLQPLQIDIFERNILSSTEILSQGLTLSFENKNALITIPNTNLKIIASNLVSNITQYLITSSSGSFYLESGDEMVALQFGEMRVDVLPNSSVIFDVDNRSIYQIAGSSLYNSSAVLEVGKYIRFEVDKYYFYDNFEFSLTSNPALKDLGYFLFDQNLLAESIQFMAPKVVGL